MKKIIALSLIISGLFAPTALAVEAGDFASSNTYAAAANATSVLPVTATERAEIGSTLPQSSQSSWYQAAETNAYAQAQFETALPKAQRVELAVEAQATPPAVYGPQAVPSYEPHFDGLNAGRFNNHELRIGTPKQFERFGRKSVQDHNGEDAISAGPQATHTFAKIALF